MHNPLRSLRRSRESVSAWGHVLWRQQLSVHCGFEVMQSAHRPFIVEGQILHQQYPADAGLGIHPELRVEDPRPGETAGTAGLAVRTGPGDFKAEAELVPTRTQRKRSGECWIGCGLLRDEYRADLVAAHERDRLRTENPDVSEPAAVEQHAHESS